MNTAHRIADSVRSIVSQWTPTSSISNFQTKGTLTPSEFVDAGDQLCFKFPTWHWQSADSRHRVSWLPPDKQFLITRNVPCRLRIADLEATTALRSAGGRDGDWVLPGEDEDLQANVKEIDRIPTAVCSVAAADGSSSSATTASPSSPAAKVAVHDQPGVCDEESVASAAARAAQARETGGEAQRQGGLRDEAVSRPMAGGSELMMVLGGEAGKETEAGRSASKRSGSSAAEPAMDGLILLGGDDDGIVDISSFQGIDDLLEEHDPALGNASHESRKCGSGSLADAEILRVRSYDLSITYDKYYQTPRIWLFGYDENGIPLTPDQIVQDIMSDYVSKTITIDPHPCTGIPTVSIHPCKHAAVMQKVVASWISAKVEPRHDLALFVLLKFMASAVPTIEYDFTMDVEMFTLPH